MEKIIVFIKYTSNTLLKKVKKGEVYKISSAFAPPRRCLYETIIYPFK